MCYILNKTNKGKDHSVLSNHWKLLVLTYQNIFNPVWSQIPNTLFRMPGTYNISMIIMTTLVSILCFCPVNSKISSFVLEIVPLI